MASGQGADCRLKCGKTTVHKTGICRACRSKTCVQCGKPFSPGELHQKHCGKCRQYGDGKILGSIDLTDQFHKSTPAPRKYR